MPCRRSFRAASERTIHAMNGRPPAPIPVVVGRTASKPPTEKEVKTPPRTLRPIDAQPSVTGSPCRPHYKSAERAALTGRGLRKEMISMSTMLVIANTKPGGLPESNRHRVGQSLPIRVPHMPRAGGSRPGISVFPERQYSYARVRWATVPTAFCFPPAFGGWREGPDSNRLSAAVLTAAHPDVLLLPDRRRMAAVLMYTAPGPGFPRPVSGSSPDTRGSPWPGG